MSRTVKKRRRTHWRKLVRWAALNDRQTREERATMSQQKTSTVLGAALAAAGVHVTRGTVSPPPAGSPPPAPSPERRPKSFQRVPFASVEAAMTTLGFKTASDFARRLGYSDSAFAGWKADGEAPLVALVAAEALVSCARLERELTQARQSRAGVSLLVTLTSDGGATVRHVDSAQSITLNGEVYVKLVD